MNYNIIVSDETIAQKIKRLREEKAKKEGKSFTKYRLAKLSGIRESYIGQLESGIVENPRRDTLESLAKGLDVPVSVFFEEKDASKLENIPLPDLVKEINQRYTAMELIGIPVKGTIPSAYPLPIEFSGTTVNIVRGQLSKLVKDIAQVYALEVKDDSLQNEGIYNGYTVIVEPESKIVNGKLYIIRSGEEVIGRRVIKENNNYVLYSSFGSYTRRPSDIEVIGRIVLSGQWKEH
jgi:SOS-response transcriptional repressor LexA